MEMDMEQNTSTIANVIYEHHLASGEKTVGVPVERFKQEKLEHHNVRIALAVLTKNGTVLDYHRCWGHTEVENGTARYAEVSTAKPKREDGEVEAYEAYHITVEPRVLKQFISQPKAVSKAKKGGLIELILDKNGDLYREPKEHYCYPMFEQAERQKTLRYLVQQSRMTTRYVKTDIAALDLEKDKDSLRREIGKINQNALNGLKIGRKVKMKDGRKKIIDGLIESKQNSGYRLNPTVKIVLN